ncbi:hypothetical protein EPN16_02520 [bacterium]|nr:MAG: hypothetical protein EPN16_02520 [bacterium]
MENVILKYHRPADYLKVFFRRKWLFITPVYAGLFLSILACMFLPRAYESYTAILVEEEKIINPLIQGLAVSTSIVQRMQTIKEQLLSWKALNELSKKLDLTKKVTTEYEFESLIRDLRRNIGVQLSGSNLIRISYTGPQPQEAFAITKALSDKLIEENTRSQTKETDLAVEFIKEQLDVYKRKIKESEVAEMEDQLKNLLIDSTEQHPLVKELKDKIALAKKEQESGNYKIAVPAEGAANSPAREALKQELDKMITQETQPLLSKGAYAAGAGAGDSGNNIYKLLLMDKVDTTMARDMDVNANIYNMLLEKLETAKITQRLEASKSGTRYNVIDPPRLPQKPIKPNTLKVILAGLIMGSLAGTGLVYGKEFLDRSYIDLEDAKAHLDLPVLGGISRIRSQEDIKKERARKTSLIFGALSSSAAVIAIALLIYFLKGK